MTIPEPGPAGPVAGSVSPLPLFPKFWMAGFECSTHRRRDGVRLDLIRATGHDRHTLGDYRACKDIGLGLIRDGLRWHRIAGGAGRFDFADWAPFLDAASEAEVEVIWDLFHYGWPDHLDPHREDFAAAFTEFAVAAAAFHAERTGRPIRAIPINEISFLCHSLDRGDIASTGLSSGIDLKRRLVRASMAAIEAIREQHPDALFYGAEPLIHVAPRSAARADIALARAERATQFEVYDMMLGKRDPELGGNPGMLDALGFNFYPHNQWYGGQGSTIPLGHHEYAPLSSLLREVGDRYRRPIFVAETGAEGSAKAAWIHYVCDEVRSARASGVEVAAVCLYPATAYPGWSNGRECETGLLGPIVDGRRTIDRTALSELDRQRGLGTDDRLARPSR